MPFVIPSEGGCQCGEIRYRLIGEPIFLGVVTAPTASTNRGRRSE